MDLFINNLEIIFYIFLWICLLAFYIRRDKRITLGIALLSLYTMQAIVALVVYTSPMSEFNGLEMSIWPFFYLFFMIYLSLKPILSLKEHSVRNIEIPNSRFLTGLCVFFSVFAIINIIIILPQIENGLQLLMVSDNEGILDIYGESTADKGSQRSFSGIINIQGVISNMANYITPLLFFTYYIKENKNKIVLVLLIIALLQGPLTGIANASRQQLLAQVFVFFLLYFFFKPYIKHQENKVFKRTFVIFISFLISVFAVITLARTSQKSYRGDSIYNMESYFAQGPINFNAYCMDANGTREGYRVAPLFLQLMGKQSLTPEQIRFKYQHMKIDSSSFATYVGDFVLDFGPIGAFAIFLCFFIMFTLMMQHGKSLSYGQVVVVFILVRFCSGYYQFGFGNVGGNLAFFLLLTLSLIFLKKDSLKNRKTEIIKRQQ